MDVKVTVNRPATAIVILVASSMFLDRIMKGVSITNEHTQEENEP